MAAVSEYIVREYFEMLGFFVHQPVKYQVAARSKRTEEEADFLLDCPARGDSILPAKLIWTSSDFKTVKRAIVSVRGWHTERFSPSILEERPEIFHFAQDTVIRRFRPILGEGPVARILCLTALPADRNALAKSEELLRSKGVDGVVLFKTMLLELAARLDVNKSYEKSELLQILRILKNYDLLKGPQMDLFKLKPSRRATRREGAPGEPA